MLQAPCADAAGERQDGGSPGTALSVRSPDACQPAAGLLGPPAKARGFCHTCAVTTFFSRQQHPGCWAQSPKSP